MATQQMHWNKIRLDVETIVGTNKSPSKILFNPYEVCIDDDGLSRFISMIYNDGSYGNFMLIPNNIALKNASEFMHKWFIRFGISMAGSALFSGKTKVLNVTKFLSTTVAADALSDYIDQVNINNSSYYEVITNECVVPNPIRFNYSDRSPNWT